MSTRQSNRNVSVTKKRSSNQIQRDIYPTEEEGSRSRKCSRMVFSKKTVEQWVSKVLVTSQYDVIDLLIKNLPISVMDNFKKTVFSNFIDLPKFKLQLQVLHCMILHAVKQNDENTFVVRFRGVDKKFQLQDFLLITGLKGEPITEEDPNTTGESEEFRKKYFENFKSIKQGDIEDKLKMKEEGGVNIQEETDLLRMSLVYFIAFFILGADPQNSVPLWIFDTVVNDSYSKVAWGILSYKRTLKSIKKVEEKSKLPESYKLQGIPYALQVWMYEICGVAEGYFCQRKQWSTKIMLARMFHWITEDKEFRKCHVLQNIFSKEGEDLDMKELQGSDNEIREFLDGKKENIQVKEVYDKEPIASFNEQSKEDIDDIPCNSMPENGQTEELKKWMEDR